MFFIYFFINQLIRCNTKRKTLKVSIFLLISEFDIVFPKGSNGTVYLNLPESTFDFSEFTLEIWFKLEHNSSTVDDSKLRLDFTNTEENDVWTIEAFTYVTFSET